MTLLWIFLLPLLGAALAPWLGRAARAMAMAVLAVDALLLVQIGRHAALAGGSSWIATWGVDWIPQLGARLALGLDGFALALALMACVVAVAALAGTPGRGFDDGAFCAWFLAGVAGVLGVFLATDLLLFFVCFELMLLPVVALVVRWGSGDHRHAAMRFFVFTQAGGLLMLLSIVGLHVVHHAATGIRTFDYAALMATPMAEGLSVLFLLGFLAAFAVKLPLVPFHTWQAQTYSSAPTEAAILLAALMAKTAGFGLLRLALPLFPGAAVELAPWLVALSVVTIVYAAWLAYGQQDIVRIIAYSSASHLGYVVLGTFAFNELGRTGAVVQMVCHGLSVAGMFLVFAHVARTTGARNVSDLGGVWKAAPSLGAVALLFTFATLGLPGLGNFVGEFMVLAGAFQRYPVAAAVAAVGAVLSAAYALRLAQSTFFGTAKATASTSAFPLMSMVVCAGLIVGLVWTGLRPQALVNLVAVPTGGAHQLAQGDSRE
jgi:NADH-quinone oxidoreductase subunit M